MSDSAIERQTQVIFCVSCTREITDDHGECAATDALRELVELKRMKDAGTTPAEYERRKAIAWREAFRVCGVIGEPKA